MRSAPNTPEAKLQYVHFALQNGTEMYTPSESLIQPSHPILSRRVASPGCLPRLNLEATVFIMAPLAPRRFRALITASAVFVAAISLVGLDARRHSSALAAQSALPTQHPGAAPVLVELFTSEGCSSCPPADALLARLQHDQVVPAANVIALEEHVDYWDSLGWRDRFSFAAVTARQSSYTRRLRLDDNYTPQMIVNGTDQFVGDDLSHALRAISQAARTPTLAITLSQLAVQDGRITGIVSITSPPPPGSDIVAAVVQAAASSQVQRGENGGRTLHHVSVLRTLQSIGGAGLRDSSLHLSLDLPKDTAPDNLRVVVFVQRDGPGAVLGAVSSPPISSFEATAAAH
jgi:hypothetical protein